MLRVETVDFSVLNGTYTSQSFLQGSVIFKEEGKKIVRAKGA